MKTVDPIKKLSNDGVDSYCKREYDRAIEIFTSLIEQNKDNVDLKRKWNWHV